MSEEMKEYRRKLREVIGIAGTSRFDEYQEGNRIAIAYAQFTLMAASIFISASFTIFGLSFTELTQDNLLNLIMLAMISIPLYLINIIYDRRYSRITHQIIFPMLRDIEQSNMKKKFHTVITEKDREWREKSYFHFTFMRIRTWLSIGGVTLVSLWCLRIYLWMVAHNFFE